MVFLGMQSLFPKYHADNLGICRGICERVALLETVDYDSAFRRRFPGRCKPSAIRCRGAESGAGRREIGRECVRVRGEACDQSRLDDEQVADLIGLIWSDSRLGRHKFADAHSTPRGQPLRSYPRRSFAKALALWIQDRNYDDERVVGQAHRLPNAQMATCAVALQKRIAAA